MSAEIRHAGIYIAGGASSIYALDRYYSQKFGMKINVAENGAMAIALGGGVALGDKALLEKIQLET